MVLFRPPFCTTGSKDIVSDQAPNPCRGPRALHGLALGPLCSHFLHSALCPVVHAPAALASLMFPAQAKYVFLGPFLCLECSSCSYHLAHCHFTPAPTNRHSSGRTYTTHSLSTPFPSLLFSHSNGYFLILFYLSVYLSTYWARMLALKGLVHRSVCRVSKTA